MTNLSKIRKSKIDFVTKIRLDLNKPLATFIFLCGCESWTLTAEMENKIQAFEMKCCIKIQGIPRENTQKRNIYLWNQIAGAHEHLLTMIKKRKLAWYGHTPKHDSLLKTVIQDRYSLKAAENGADKERVGPITSKNGPKCLQINL